MATKSARTVDIKKLKADVIVDERDLEVLGTDEREHVREYVRMFKRLRSLAKKLERDCLDSETGGRGIYALCTIYSQQREVIADIRTLTDLSGQVQMIDEQILQPFTRSVGQQVLNVYYQLRRLLTETTDKKQTQFALDKLEEITKDLSSVLQSQYDESATKVCDMLMGPTQSSTANQPKKKKRG